MKGARAGFLFRNRRAGGGHDHNFAGTGDGEVHCKNRGLRQGYVEVLRRKSWREHLHAIAFVGQAGHGNQSFPRSSEHGFRR